MSTPGRLAAGAAELSRPRDGARVQAIETMMRTHGNDVAGAKAVAGAVLANPDATLGSRALAASVLGHLRALEGNRYAQ